MATRWLVLVLSQVLLLVTSLTCGNTSLKIKTRRKLNASCVLRSLHTTAGLQICVSTFMNKHCGSYKAQDTKYGYKEKQGTLLQTFSKLKHCSDARVKEITDHITDFVALDMWPMHDVEGEGFLRMIVYLEPGYKVPSRKHITSIIWQKHDHGKEKLQTKLSEATSLSLTRDIWMSTATTAYITMTGHFVTISWDLCSCIFETTAFPECHTGPAIALKLQEIITRFKVDTTKVIAIVHDQAANMELSLRILQKHHNINSIRCSGLCLQLCLKTVLSINIVDRLLGAARKLVGHFKHSVVATEELKRRQMQMAVAQKKLIQDCTTRWNSTFYML